MILYARVYSIMVEHNRAVPMIEQINQIMDPMLDRADHSSKTQS